MDEARLIEQWLSRNAKLWKGGTPKNEKQAKRRFRCKKLAGGCVLSGADCASRHAFAKARSQKKTKASDGHIYWNHRDDSICGSCDLGETRARLLNINENDWRKRYRDHKARRHAASVKRDAEENIEGVNDDISDELAWAVDARPRGQKWE